MEDARTAWRLAARWGETAISGGLAAVFLWGGISAGLAGAWLGWPVAGIGLVAGAWAFLAFQRARLAAAAATRGPGVVSVEEGRIAYFAPEHDQLSGGVVALENLFTVEATLLKREQGRAWRLRPLNAAPIVISVEAEGAERLPEALSALPGFSMAVAARAFERQGVGVRPIWRREDDDRPRMGRPRLGEDEGEDPAGGATNAPPGIGLAPPRRPA